jgi:hypothetical protein
LLLIYAFTEHTNGNNNSSIIIIIIIIITIIIPVTLFTALMKADNYNVLSIVMRVLGTFYSSPNELSPDEFKSISSTRHLILCNIVPRFVHPYTSYCNTSSSSAV